MNIIKRTLRDVTVLDLEGSLALGENAKFRQHVAASINAGARKLIVNLARVEYMDSCGLGELISGYTAMQRVSGHFKLLNLSNRLQRLLVITKLTSLFETFDSELAAVASFTPVSSRSALAHSTTWPASGQSIDQFIPISSGPVAKRMMKRED